MPPKRKTVPKENIPPKREKLQEEIPSKKPDDKPKAEELPKVAKEDKVPGEESTVDDDAGAELSDKLMKRFDEQPPGKLLIAGLVTWELTGGPKAKPVSNVRPNLYSFHRFTSEMYRSAVTGCCSAHSVLITMDRKALAFGRNQHGQLGQSDLRTFEKPTPVNGLKDVKVVQAACGRNHTLFLTDNGVVYACGDNRHGQCGVGHTNPTVLKATRLKYTGPPIVKVACGAEFSMILDINGRLYSFGLPEHGQLGHNTDGKYFITANRLAYHYETVPRQIVTYVEKTNEGRTIPIEDVQILDFACGNNHTVAIDSKNRAFSWGFGGYGRLGHASPQDEWVPRLNKYFDIQKRKVLRVFCGTAFSVAITDVGCVHLFGRNRVNADANMYPKPVQDLTGWKVTSIGAGYSSILISADDSLIAWGASPTYGELGLGDEVKSSSKPKLVPGMEGVKISHAAVGQSHSLLLVNVEHEFSRQKYDELPEFIVD
ncbi:AAEL013820-PA [Aedes aegypti]|uniref:AAEL013820-PA n=1 Tax=Aedes aegypti TaxID=7159 RepID=Q16I29_AEDAE|nr:AAEL013820-PA [Aedes aegypti]